MNERSLIELTSVDLDLACLKEQNNRIAVSQGLPPIGATLINAHGIEWIVDGHTYAPSVMTLGRTETATDPRDLYPVSIPQNLSQGLQDMLQELHACTPKDFVPLDTVPHLRPDQAMPFSHSVDSGSDPNRILLFFDAARIHEAAFAHELAHVWVELVDGIEDYRVLEDLTDSVRYGQVQRIQSFVLDFGVNDLIRSRGFDTFDLEHDRIKSLKQLSVAAAKGYEPPTRWESVVMAMLLAEVFIESSNALANQSDVFEIIREKLTEEWALAEDLTEIVTSEPRTSADSAKRCIDKALVLSFTFAGEHLDLEKDLIERPPAIAWRDKWPGWLRELTPQQKCEVGKAMARSGLGGMAKVQLLNSINGAGVQFSTDGVSWTDPVALPFRLPDPTRPHESASRIMEINEQNRRRQMEQFERMKNHTPGRRAYATGEARFITQVRMEQMLAGEHPYAYAFNNPTTYVDPDGLSPQKRKATPKPVNHIQLASLCASAGVLQSACDGLDLDKVYKMLICVIEAEVADPGSMYWGPNVMKSDGGYAYDPNVPDRNIGPCRIDINLVNDSQSYFRKHPPHGKPYNGTDPDWYKTPCDNIVEGAIALCSQIKQKNGAGDYSFPWGRWLQSDETRYKECMSMASKMPPRYIFK